MKKKLKQAMGCVCRPRIRNSIRRFSYFSGPKMGKKNDDDGQKMQLFMWKTDSLEKEKPVGEILHSAAMKRQKKVEIEKSNSTFVISNVQAEEMIRTQIPTAFL